MIPHDEFYRPEDRPSSQHKQLLWQRIQHSLPLQRTRAFREFHRPSFVWGIAASFVLAFAGIGAYTSLSFLSDVNQPRQVKLERAYQSAIREFEQVALTDRSSGATDKLPDARALRAEQLKQLDSAINRLRDETRGGDLSPLVQSRLRSLYSMKLQILQLMIEQGDLEL